MLVTFVVLADADLGLGIISLLRKRHRKAELIEAIGPQWYANETWLVIAGATLFGAFPHAFGIILSSLYVPMMMLIFGLMIRAVSTEFRHQKTNERFWDLAFGSGCLVAALGQGFLLGGLLTNPGAVSLPGIGTWNWLNPITALISIGAVIACITLGAVRLINRQSSVASEIWCFLRYSIALSMVIFFILAISFLVAPSEYNKVWSDNYRIILVPLFAVVTLLCLTVVWFSSRKQVGRGLYYLNVIGLVSAFGLIVTIVYPFIIPFSHTITDASSPGSTQSIMLFGVAIVLPIIIFYNIYIARVFSRPGRDKPAVEGDRHTPESFP